MNTDQFRAMLDLGRDGDPGTVLPGAHGRAERIFGGQILAQLVAALAPDRAMKSLYVAFPREGRPHDPLYFAYVSGWPLIGTLLKAVPGTSQQDAHVRLQTGVVSHSIWFHQLFDVSEWLRVEIRGERLAGGRGFGTGAVYTQGGSLVASFAQESVIRPFA